MLDRMRGWNGAARDRLGLAWSRAGAFACALALAASGCKSGTGDADDSDSSNARPGATGKGGGDAHGGAGGASGANGSGGARHTTGSGGSAGPTLPSFSGDDASGITRLADCALAHEGLCANKIERDHEAVCNRWKADYPTRGEMTFVGGKDSCDPGETDPQAIDDAVRRLNLYRWLMDQDPVEHDVTWDGDARACAVIQAYLSPAISHDPEPTARCYSDQASLASSQSNIAVGDRDPSTALDGLLFDAGNNNKHALGHRQLLLHPGLTTVGIGYTEIAREDLMRVDPYGASCVQVFTQDKPLGERRSGLDGMVAYPPPGVFPYEPITWAILGTTRGEDGVEQRLQWSLSFADDTDVAGASARMYRQAADTFEEVAIDFGPLEKTAPGLWMLPRAEVEPGTYVVIVDGTELGAFGYRSLIEPCGPTLELTCDIATQQCGDQSAGCYDIDAPYCAVGAGIPLGERCGNRKLTDCAHGGACRPLSKAEDPSDRRCTSYCDTMDATSPIACAALCPGQYVKLTDRNGTERPLGACHPGAGGTCDPLQQDCAEGHGCYGREAVTCAFSGPLESGARCTGMGVECQPGTNCVGIQGETPICSPYCDPSPAANGPLACNALCPWGHWQYGDYALCEPPRATD